jgi:hypothetical protein
VLSPRDSLDISGWRKSLSETAAYYFTALPDSYAARTGRPDDVGVIGVALFRRKQAPPPPASRISDPKPAAAARAAESDSRLGTGHGPARAFARGSPASFPTPGGRLAMNGGSG